MSVWISFDDQKPEFDDDWVLVWNSATESIDLLPWYSDNDYVNLSHWMPTPDKPITMENSDEQ